MGRRDALRGALRKIVENALAGPIHAEVRAALEDEGWCGPAARQAIEQAHAAQVAQVDALLPRLEAAEGREAALAERLKGLEAELAERRAADQAPKPRAKRSRAKGD